MVAGCASCGVVQRSVGGSSVAGVFCSCLQSSQFDTQHGGLCYQSDCSFENGFLAVSFIVCSALKLLCVTGGRSC